MRAVIRKRLRVLGGFVMVGAVVGAAIGVLIKLIDGGALGPHTLRGTITGILIGAALGFGEEFVFVDRSSWRSYRRVTALRITAYIGAVLLALVAVNGAWAWVTLGTPFSQAALDYVNGETMGRDLVLAIAFSLAGTAFLEIRKLHNPGDIRGFLLGRYRFPVEETRLFLFADLEGSTRLAEQLGPHRYSLFLGDCYRDMAEAILAWRGHVYQYVGDEIIVSWPLARGLRDAACVECFFAMTDLLAANDARYRERYGCTPRFRGSVHGGTVVTTWVGLTNMELASHGDVLNATARIQDLCKQAGEDCLVSGPVLDRIELPGGYRARSLGMAELRGKEEPLELYAVGRDGPTD